MQRKAAVKTAFILGKDHGEACVLERAAELLPTANLEAEALGNAFAIVMGWVNAFEGRSFHGAVPSSNSGPGYEWHGTVMRSDLDKLRDKSETWSEYVWGTTMLDAMAKLAAWCTEHAAAFPPRAATVPPARDTEPKLVVAEPVFEQALGADGSAIGLVEVAPSTERNL
jgi:hypothetical protein